MEATLGRGSVAARAALGMSLLVLASCGRERGPEGVQEPAVEVEVAEAQVHGVPETQEAVGTIQARLSATVAAKVMAVIQRVPVHAGDFVRAGQLLAKLDDRDLRAEFERARADYQRLKRLLERDAVTRSEFDSARARYRVAAAELSHARLTAPFAGIIAEKFCDVGDLAVPGKPLLRIEQPTAFRLEAAVPERFSGRVEVGEKIRVLVDATGEVCPGTVGEVVPAADPVSRSFLIKIDLRCREPLSSGMFGRAELPVGERRGLFVAREAVHRRGQLRYVFVASGGRARMRLVKTGGEYPEGVEVLAGLEAGEQVVVGADEEVRDGQPIEAR